VELVASTHAQRAEAFRKFSIYFVSALQAVREDDKSQGIISSMLARGYILAADTMNKARALDERYQVSGRRPPSRPQKHDQKSLQMILMKMVDQSSLSWTQNWPSQSSSVFALANEWNIGVVNLTYVKKQGFQVSPVFDVWRTAVYRKSEALRYLRSRVLQRLSF
jgi:hypothetical protein